MIKIVNGEIPKELLKIHQHWFETYVDKKISELESERTFKLNGKKVEINKKFLKKVRNWKEEWEKGKNEKLGTTKELIFVIKSFKKTFKDIDDYFLEEGIKNRLIKKRNELELIRDRYKEMFLVNLSKEEKKDIKEKREKELKVIKEDMKKIAVKKKNETEKKSNKTLCDYINGIELTESKILNFTEDGLKDYFEKEEELEKQFDLIKYIFNYNFFSNLEEFPSEKTGEKIKWGRHEFLSRLGVTVCPYCNRQYVNNYKEDDRDKTTADLDHFYIKSLYPYLALSIYNFIPSCQICNRTFKGAIDFFGGKESNHIYPYNEEFGDDVKFTIEIENNDESVLLGTSDNFKIKFDIDENSEEKIKNSIETFKLDKMYSQNHKDYVRELIKKAIIYNESRITELYSQYGELFDSREEVVNMIMSNYISKEEIGKRPLGKLTRDICEELGIDIK